MDGSESGEGSLTDFREHVIRLLPGAWVTENGKSHHLVLF